MACILLEYQPQHRIICTTVSGICEVTVARESGPVKISKLRLILWLHFELELLRACQ